MLAARFSGRWDESLEKDRDGNFFIDQPIELFLPMINFLRSRACETPLMEPTKSPTLSTFVSSTSMYESFLRMVEYYGMTPGVYPTQVWLHAGKEEGSQILGLKVTAKEWSVFTLKPRGHTRAIKSFEVTLGEVESFQIGWLIEASWQSNTAEPNQFGVGDISGSFGLDLTHSRFAYGGTSTFTPVEGATIGRGTVIRCSAASDGSKRMPELVIDGTKIDYDKNLFTGGLATSAIPAFSGKGEWSVTNVELCS